MRLVLLDASAARRMTLLPGLKAFPSSRNTTTLGNINLDRANGLG
jgi:hypothetical protein